MAVLTASTWRAKGTQTQDTKDPTRVPTWDKTERPAENINISPCIKINLKVSADSKVQDEGKDEKEMARGEKNRGLEQRFENERTTTSITKSIEALNLQPRQRDEGTRRKPKEQQQDQETISLPKACLMQPTNKPRRSSSLPLVCPSIHMPETCHPPEGQKSQEDNNEDKKAKLQRRTLVGKKKSIVGHERAPTPTLTPCTVHQACYNTHPIPQPGM
jgi:hypothetical protein